MLSREFRNTVAQGEAEQLWKLYGFAAPSDVVLEDLALAREVIVTEGPLEKAEARLIRSGTKGLIRIRQGIPEIGRKRFAIAHELGHWELHQAVSQLFACSSDDMVASYRTSVYEGDANFFAACLLMPSGLFQKQTDGRDFSFKMVAELADYFITSLTATAIRYVDLSQDCCAVVASEASRIRWWRGSSGFEERFWLSAGTKLSRNTIAGSFFYEGGRSEGPEEVDIGAWSEREPSSGSGTFIEESMHMERYGQVLTLLRQP